MTDIKIKRLDPRAKMPEYASAFSAGADLCAHLDSGIIIAPGETALIPTGLAAELPEGTVGLVCARSGLSVKKGLAPANKVGVIDSDYRGEITVALYNHGSTAADISPGDRIAQLLIMPVLQARFFDSDELSESARGTGGFGSTGR